MPFRSYFIPSELVKSEFVSLGNYSKGFHAASNRFEGSHIIENWKHFQGQNYVTKRTCGDRGELGLSKSRAVKICDQIFLFFSKKISSRFDMMRIVVVAHFFFFFFFFLFIRRPRAWCGYKVATRGTWRHSRADRPISVAATVSNIMQASESHLKCKYLQRE